MGSVRILVLLVAAVAAIGLAFVVRGAFAPKAPPPVAVTAPAPPPGKPMAQVLTARRDLPIGTRLATTDMGWTAWPVEALNPAFVTDGAAPIAAGAEPTGGAKVVKSASDVAAQVIGGGGPMSQFEGAIVREPMLTGEPIIQRKVVRGGEGGYLSVVLTPGRRAVAVPINVESGAGGFILPGDRVDVLQSREVNSPSAAMTAIAAPKNSFVADTVLSNVRVLAIDQNIEAPKAAKSLVGATATLEVTPADAEMLMRAKSQGTLILSLRAYTDTGGPSGAVTRETTAQSNIVRINRGGAISSEPVRP
jgi:pilus assembly protein CpaB